MKPMHYIHIFAGISITALCFQIFSDFWLPLMIGAVSMFAISAVLRK
jgi:predicted PurR-regulated permease PerM